MAITTVVIVAREVSGATLRVASVIESFEEYDVNSSKALQVEWEKMPDGAALGYGYYPAERGVEIPIIELKARGIYSVEIGAELRGGGTTTVEFWLYHAGR